MERSFYRVLDHAQPASAIIYKSFRRFGFDGVMRYLASPDLVTSKRVTPAEVKLIHDAGLNLHLVFQNGSNGAAYFTYARGRLDGQHAREAAAVLGFPRSLPIYFAVDYNAQPADYDGPLLSYFNGVYDGMLHADGRPAHPVGIYGHYALLLHVQRNWPGVENQWQTYAWSSGLVLPGCDGTQYSNGATVAGHNVDLNEFRIRGWHLAP